MPPDNTVTPYNPAQMEQDFQFNPEEMERERKKKMVMQAMLGAQLGGMAGGQKYGGVGALAGAAAPMAYKWLQNKFVGGAAMPSPFGD